MIREKNGMVKTQLYLDKHLNTFKRIKHYTRNRSNLYKGSAETYDLNHNTTIVEFTTKANTLDDNSMQILSKASEQNLIIINGAMQFSAGVNLNYVMEYAKDSKWRGIEKFIFNFQQTCKNLKIF